MILGSSKGTQGFSVFLRKCLRSKLLLEVGMKVLFTDLALDLFLGFPSTTVILFRMALNTYSEVFFG